jgi:hypothetical protein
MIPCGASEEATYLVHTYQGSRSPHFMGLHIVTELGPPLTVVFPGMEQPGRSLSMFQTTRKERAQRVSKPLVWTRSQCFQVGEKSEDGLI